MRVLFTAKSQPYPRYGHLAPDTVGMPPKFPWALNSVVQAKGHRWLRVGPILNVKMYFIVFKSEES